LKTGIKQRGEKIFQKNINGSNGDGNI